MRASIHGQLRVMVPLISRLDEVRAIKSIFRQCRQELVVEGHALANNIPFGIMIEVPSAALIAQHLAREVDFFSIGTKNLFLIAVCHFSLKTDHIVKTSNNIFLP